MRGVTLGATAAKILTRPLHQRAIGARVLFSGIVDPPLRQALPAFLEVADLDEGADDYLSEPFSPQELHARMRAVLRRSYRAVQATAGVLMVGQVRLDLARRWAHNPRGEVHLTRMEYRVLECLARQSGFVVSHARLVEEIWGPSHQGDTRSLRVCIKNLRRKLERNPHRPRLLTTELGIGYRLQTYVR